MRQEDGLGQEFKASLGGTVRPVFLEERPPCCEGRRGQELDALTVVWAWGEGL